MPGVRLTKRQSQSVYSLVSAFLERGMSSPAVSHEFLIMCKTIMLMIADNTPFEQVELDVVVFLLESYFDKFEENDVDPYAEQAYAKLTGYWPECFDAPWYDRIVTYADTVGYQPRKSSRDTIGF